MPLGSMTLSSSHNKQLEGFVSKAIVVGAIALGALAAALIYFGGESAQNAGTIRESTSDASTASLTERPERGAQPSTHTAAVRESAPTERSVPIDPRVAALSVSPDNGLIEFVAAPDGTVIKEIDKDPNSLGFRKPSREYTYSEGRVIGMIEYKHLGTQVQISKTAVSYKADGSVDQYLESTTYESADNSSTTR
jgi:hypothetical protein